jgi:ubiquinol-cytochrome c reductase cytochrome c1 subunit
MMLKPSLLFFVALFGATLAHADLGGEVPLLPVTIDLKDKQALQRGAKYYMNYCSGCHSLKYMRYNRMAKDLGIIKFDGDIDTDLLENNLIFTHAKEYDPIEISMPATDARQWFGVEPPDLTLVTRKRGVSWVYTYLQSFYEDKTRPFGSNNLLIPGVAMPNVLAPLAGKRIAIRDGNIASSPISHLVLLGGGSMHALEFENMVKDLVTFLAYVGEPMRLERQHMGVFVLAFLFVLLLLVYSLKKIYWKRLKQK